MTPEDIRDRVRTRLAEQRTLVEQLLRRREQLSGSLFVRFGGIDYDDDDDAIAKLDDFIRHVQRIVSSFGGNLLNLTLGDKGGYVYAAFGALENPLAVLAQARELEHDGFSACGIPADEFPSFILRLHRQLFQSLLEEKLPPVSAGDVGPCPTATLS